MSFSPNTARANTIGIADRYYSMPRTDPYRAEILDPVFRTARGLRWDVLYYSGYSDEGGLVPTFLDGRSDGLLCFTGVMEDSDMEAILQSGLPVVFIGGAGKGQWGSIIDVDSTAGSVLAMEHLIGLGHTRIAMMEGFGYPGNEERVDGWRKTLEAHNLPAHDSLLFPSLAFEGSGYAHAMAMLSKPKSERATAVFCFNDVIALDVLRAARACHLRVPRDLSVVGFDDVALSAKSDPPLTTIRQPLAKIGDRAVRILIGIIEKSLTRNYREIVPPKLIVRESTAPPSS